MLDDLLGVTFPNKGPLDKIASKMVLEKKLQVFLESKVLQRAINMLSSITVNTALFRVVKWQ
jgi:hypothetical protein